VLIEERGVTISRTKIGILLLLLCTVFAVIFNLAQKGIDFSDEGKYLLDAKYPNSSASVISHYGYVYHFIFSLINFDVAHFRFFNFLITFGIATITTSYILKYLGLVQKQFSYLSFKLSITSGIVSLTHFSVFWLPTPSYNSLTFQTMMICMMAMSRFAYKEESRVTIYTLTFSSFAFALLFLAKPPALLILIFVFFLLMRISHRIGYKEYCSFISLLFLWLLLFSHLIYGNTLGIFYSVEEGIRFAQKLTATYSTKAQVILDVPPYSIWVALFCGLTILIISFFGNKYLRNLTIGFMALLSISTILLILIFQNQDRFFTSVGNSFLIILAFVFASIAIDKINFRGLIGAIKPIWPLLILPLICAAGTNNNVWIQSSMNFYFVYLFGLFFLLKFKPYFFLDHRSYLLILLTIILSLSSIDSITHRPYRQISQLSDNNFHLTFPKEMNKIQVTEDVGQRIREMLQAMKLGGFKSGTSVIDFTGQSPTALFIAQALPAGDSWLVGGYEGSNRYAIERLSQMSCIQLFSSWLLVEDGGPKSLNHQLILNNLGLDISSYEKVAAWRTPRGAGGYDFSRKQILYKPLMSLKGCESRPKD